MYINMLCCYCYENKRSSNYPAIRNDQMVVAPNLEKKSKDQNERGHFFHLIYNNNCSWAKWTYFSIVYFHPFHEKTMHRAYVLSQISPRFSFDLDDIYIYIYIYAMLRLSTSFTLLFASRSGTRNTFPVNPIPSSASTTWLLLMLGIDT